MDRHIIESAKGPARQTGMTLFEILIALVILSVGLGGMAALQITTLQYTHSAHYRSVASSAALELEERLWIKLADDTLTGCPDLTNSSGTALNELLTDFNQNASGGTGDDVWTWSSSSRIKIPNLNISLGTVVTGTQVTEVPITLTWAENRFSDEGEATTESFQHTIRVFCRVPAATT